MIVILIIVLSDYLIVVAVLMDGIDQVGIQLGQKYDLNNVEMDILL